MALNMIRITFGDNGGAGFEVAFQESLRDAGVISFGLPGAGSAGLFSGVLRTLLASTPSGAIRIQLARFRHPLGTRVGDSTSLGARTSRSLHDSSHGGNQLSGYLRHLVFYSESGLMGISFSELAGLLRWFYSLRRDCRAIPCRL